MLFIHLGLPKTTSTNLQKKFFSKFKKIENLELKYSKLLINYYKK